MTTTPFCARREIIYFLRLLTLVATSGIINSTKEREVNSMFCPFNAAMARFTSKTSVAGTESETEILIKAYKEIAHVWINRAAERGLFSTYIYVPYEVRALLDDLRESGFEVKYIKDNRYNVYWGIDII